MTTSTPDTRVNADTDISSGWEPGPIRPPFLTTAGGMSNAPAPSLPTYTTFTFITTAGNPAGSWDVELGGDSFERMHLAALWVSEFAGVPVEELVPAREDLILGYPSLWPHEHDPHFGTWRYRDSIRYRVYADPELTQADAAKAKARVRLLDRENRLIFTPGPADVSGPFESPTVTFEAI